MNTGAARSDMDEQSWEWLLAMLSIKNFHKQICSYVPETDNCLRVQIKTITEEINYYYYFQKNIPIFFTIQLT